MYLIEKSQGVSEVTLPFGNGGDQYYINMYYLISLCDSFIIIVELAYSKHVL